MAAASPVLNPDQAKSILEPMKNFAQGIANLSEKASPVIAPVKEIGAAAKRTATGAVQKVSARVQSAGLHPEEIVSTIFEDNPLANAIYGIGADAVSGTLKAIGGGFSAIKTMIFGKNEPLDDIKDDVSKLRKVVEGEAKREKGVVKAQRRASAFAGLEAAERTEEERRRRRAQATSAFSKGKVDEKTGLMKPTGDSMFPDLSGIMPDFSSLFANIGTGMGVALGMRLSEKIIGPALKFLPKLLGKTIAMFFRGIFGSKGIFMTLLRGGGGLAKAIGAAPLVAKAFSSVAGLLIDGVLGFFMADEWGSSKLGSLVGGALGGTLKSGSWLGTAIGAGKWAMIGITAGTVGGPIGMIIGGVLGAMIGGILGYIGGENISEFADKVGAKLMEGLKMTSELFTQFLDNIIIAAQNVPGLKFAMDALGIKTSKQKAAEQFEAEGEIKEHAEGEKRLAKIIAEDREMVPDESGRGMRFASDEEMKEIKSSRAALATPEMIALATSGPEGAAEYVKLVKAANKMEDQNLQKGAMGGSADVVAPSVNIVNSNRSTQQQSTVGFSSSNANGGIEGDAGVNR